MHTNVWAPDHVQSLGGSRYYVTLSDDATRKKWFYCIRLKYDVFDTFDNGKRLKCLRYDNGDEYCSKDFDGNYSYHGVCREKRVPGTP